MTRPVLLTLGHGYSAQALAASLGPDWHVIAGTRDPAAAAPWEPLDWRDGPGFLLQQGFLGRTPRGRIATRRAFEHLKRPLVTRADQGKLF